MPGAVPARPGSPDGLPDAVPGGPAAAVAGPAVAEGGLRGESTVGLVTRLRAVLRVRDFRRLWASMALSSFGDWLGLLAITATATSLVDSFAAQNFALGAVLLFRLLPAIVLGPLAGAIADRFDRRRTMVVCDLLRFALFASIPVVGDLVWLLVAQFLIEAVTLFWQPAKEAAVPNMLRRDQLEPANQLSLITTYGLTPVLAALAFALFTTIGGQLEGAVATLGPEGLALYLNALTFLVAAVVIGHLPSISGRPATRQDAVGGGFLRSLRDGFAFAGHTRLVRGLVVGITGAFVAAGVVIATAQAFARSVGGGEASYGLLFGAVFIGLGLGITLGPGLARGLSRERTFGVAIVGAGVVLALLTWASALWVALLLVVLMGFCAGIAYLAGFTLLGTEVDDDLRGRTFALVQSLVRAALIVSLALVPFVVGLLGRHRVDLGPLSLEVAGERAVLFLAGLLAVAVGVVAYRQMDGGGAASPVAEVGTAQRQGATVRRRLAGGGVLIAVEGGEGAGKTTQARRLQEWLTGQGVVTRATAGAAAPASRYVRDVLRPALDAGEVVVTDGSAGSSLVHREAARELRADLIVLLDVPGEVGLARVRGRAAVDRLGAEHREFHQRVRRTLRALAEADPDRYLVLDARRPPDDLATAIRVRVGRLLAGLPLQHLPTRVARARRAEETGAQTGRTSQLQP